MNQLDRLSALMQYPHSIPALNRITTRYQPVEDRVCVSGLIGSGDVVVIWLTCRLLNRLVPVLIKWLDSQERAAQRKALSLGSAQLDTRMASDAVQDNAVQDSDMQSADAVSADDAACSWLAVSVDIQQRAEDIVLVFKDKADKPTQVAALSLKPEVSRQWLKVLHMAYVQGQWSLDIWPDWVRAQSSVPGLSVGRVVH